MSQQFIKDDDWDFPLKKDTIKLYAINNYTGSKVSWKLFFEDYKNFLILKRRLNSYKNKNSDNIHSTLNVLITLGNVFKGNSLARIAFFIVPKELHPQLKSFLIFIFRLPNEIPEIDVPAIQEDKVILDKLNKLGLKNHSK